MINTSLRASGAVIVGVLFALFAASPAEAQERRDRNRIAPEEIQESGANNVYDLIQSRRTNWLSRARGTSLVPTASPGSKDDSAQRPGSNSILVILDGAQIDDPDALKSLPTSGVRLVEYVNAGQTRYRFGRYSAAGAIVVYMTTDPPSPSSTQ